MDTNGLVALLVVFGGFAVVFLCLAAWSAVAEFRAWKRGEQPNPGQRVGTDWSATLGIFFAILAAVLAAWVSTE